MVRKLPQDRRGRTWLCVMCRSVFFIPEIHLKEQREVGCPICSKNKWKLVSYNSLFIKDTSKSEGLTQENEINEYGVGL